MVIFWLLLLSLLSTQVLILYNEWSETIYWFWVGTKNVNLAWDQRILRILRQWTASSDFLVHWFQKYSGTVLEAASVLQQNNFIYVLPFLVKSIFYSGRTHFSHCKKCSVFLQVLQGSIKMNPASSPNGMIGEDLLHNIVFPIQSTVQAYTFTVTTVTARIKLLLIFSLVFFLLLIHQVVIPYCLPSSHSQLGFLCVRILFGPDFP